MKASGHTIAVGGILTECNHFGGLPMGLDSFERCELRRGDEVLTIRTGVVAGMLDVLHAQQARPAPLLFASACPGGTVTADCYHRLKSELLERLVAAGPVSGVLLALHGAMAAEGTPDCEGDLIRAVRQTVGAWVPIVVSLDLHAQVTGEMVRHASALVAWETYPHRDAQPTGQRAARLLLDAVSGKAAPAMAMAKVPVITSAIHGSTDGDDPFAHLMRQTKSLECLPGVLSTSLFLGHPYLDIPDMGSGALVITDGDADRAAALAGDIARRYWEKRFELEPKVHGPDEAIRLGLQAQAAHILLVEAADCCGGGAAGDSVAALRALLESNISETAMVPVVDAAAARACHAAGVGGAVSVELGHHHDPRWGRPLAVRGRVRRLSDGRFTYGGGIWDGVEAAMGPAAILEIGKVLVLVATHATYDWADEQFRSLGLNPADARFLVVKNPMNYRNISSIDARAIYFLDTPGPTPATLRHVHFRNLRRPYFPADQDIPGLQPRILDRRQAGLD